MSLWRWFTSRKYREVSGLIAGARRVVNEQRDLLPPDALAELQQAIAELVVAHREGRGGEPLDRAVHRVHEVAERRLRVPASPALRENILELQSTFVKILACFSFFLQPMAIPSGSAQPTLYGITQENHRGDDRYTLPGWPTRIFEACVFGVRYYHLVAETEGSLEAIEEPRSVFPLIKRQRLRIGGAWHTVWFPPENLPGRAELYRGQHFARGEDILKLKVRSGDHLLVDRFTYNFRRPHRGETIVFVSTGIPGLIQNTHYIKRLIALGDENVSIGDDRLVRINGNRLDRSTPGFERVYRFDGPPQDSVYSGHVNGTVGQRHGRPNLAPLFPDPDTDYRVRPHHYLVFGDNTMNSHDSRAWGDFPEQKTVGKAVFVFWPLSPRIAWGFSGKS